MDYSKEELKEAKRQIDSTLSLVDAVIREIKEETGLTLHQVQLCGIKQFYLADKATRYLVFCTVVMIFQEKFNPQKKEKSFG